MLSLCLIVKDEEETLTSFLNSVKDFVDEIIIVDTGSKDNSKEIAFRFTSKVYDFKWCDDFSTARNFSISKASGDWILVLDPDETIDKKDLIKIKEITSGKPINKNNNILGYRLIQETYSDGKLISVRGICRLFKNNKNIKFIYPIHETVRESIKELDGKIGKTGIVIKHYPKLSEDKKKYYLKLLKDKKNKFPSSNVDKEIENEELFSTF